ncbi:MAG: FG-GAP-like repeat-containing protein [Flavobacteriales bacterium]
MKKFYLVALSLWALADSASAQSFTASSIGGSAKHSGNCGAVSDVNNDGLADVIILDQSENVYVAYQQNDGSFNTVNYGSVSSASQWGMTVADIDNDGWAEVLSGGNYDGVHVLDIDGTNMSDLTTYNWASIFMQACSFADIDNDGWLDGFACHDDGHNALFHNNGDGTFDNGVGMIDMVFYPEVNGNDNSGNYGVVWCDFDRDGDQDCLIAKCRQFINDPYDPRRTNVLLVNDGQNNYSDEAPARGLVNLEQSWTADFGDVDNDGDFDCFITTHSGTLEIYENDGLGYFTNITAGSGLEVSGFFLQGKLADFDNDGYLDVIYAGGTHGYYRNNGDKTWTNVPNTFQNSDTMHSFAFGDLNHDGFLDLYATYGDGYVSPDFGNDNVLFLNNTNDNHYIVFDLEGTISNKMAVGAVVEIHGAFGTQVRDVRSGESYGITNTNQLHFGIGEETSVDYAIIRWPAGGITVIENPAIDQFHNVIETACPSVNVTASIVGSATGCPINLESSGNFQNHIWSNATMEATTQAFSDGLYYVIVYDENGCGSISNSIEIDVTEDPAPAVSLIGETTFCEGGSLTLNASNGNAFAWSNGAVSQSITVSESGEYFVDVTGGCGTQRTETIEVNVLSNPAPVANDVEVELNQTANLTATGSNIQWFDSMDATEPVASGNSFTTPEITGNTTYYVQSSTQYGGAEAGGKTDFASDEGGNLTNANFFLRFDAYEPFTLNSVMVKAQTAGNRTIVLVDAAGNTVQEATVDIPAGESVVTLNFNVPAGVNHGLRGQGGSNPNLWRDKDLTTAAPFGFPYELGTYGAITGTTVAGQDFDNYYYFFYDWQVSTPISECVSERVPVNVSILVGVNDIEGLNDFSLFPNPGNDIVNVAFNGNFEGAAQVNLLDAQGRMVSSNLINNAKGKQNVAFNVSNLASGVYHVQVIANNKTANASVVIR